MISLPLLQSLHVEGYGLYPGSEPGEGLKVDFKPGLTLVLGANGLGKTTLVTILFRLLTGPHDISALMTGSDLGTASLKLTGLRPKAKRTLANRVADGGVGATARLEFDIDNERVSIERSLRDLTLRSLKINSNQLPQSEATYQSEIVRLAGVSTFSDWILLLRYVIFFLERRRSLVWDPSAQRQLLRILFLDSAESERWMDREREILEADTRMRNLRAVTTREETILGEEESKTDTESSTRAELADLNQLQETDQASYDEILESLDQIIDNHESSRLRYFQLEQKRESSYRKLERHQLESIDANLPQPLESAKYLLAKLLTEDECLACGNEVPQVADSMKARIDDQLCIICGSGIVDRSDSGPSRHSTDDLAALEEEFRHINSEFEASKDILAAAEEDRRRAVEQSQELRAAISSRTRRISELITRLPQDELELKERRDELRALRANLDQLRRDLDSKREAFEEIVMDANAAVAEQSTKVQEAFENNAHRFLFENCRLVYSPNSTRLGQEGRSFEFPAFGLELEGSDFGMAVRRHGPDDVSESQREFIDLSFRMALAQVGTQGGVTSLVVDAPESSLDAVFVERAAEVLGEFARGDKDNRLVVTSNISGELVPKLLSRTLDSHDQDGRVVDLLTVAVPTAATTGLRHEYERARDQLLGRAPAEGLGS